MKRRNFCQLLPAAVLLPLPAPAAEPYPNRPITLVVPFGPGLSTDAIARYYAEEMGKLIGQPIVVDNRAGAQGSVGSQMVARAAPDGYTLVFASNGSHAGNVALFKKLAYDPVKDFAPIGPISAAPWALTVRPDFPARDLPEFLRYAAANPGAVSVAHGSASSQACVALLETKGGVDVNDIPYKSLQPAMFDMEAKRLDASFLPLGISIVAHKSGKLRVLAISAGKRSQLAPDIPAIAEVLPGYELVSWVGLMAPADTPPEVIRRLHAALTQVSAKPETRDKLTFFGHDAMAMEPDRFGQLVVADIGRWRQLVQDAHIEQQ